MYCQELKNKKFLTTLAVLMVVTIGVFGSDYTGRLIYTANKG